MTREEQKRVKALRKAGKSDQYIKSWLRGWRKKPSKGVRQ